MRRTLLLAIAIVIPAVSAAQDAPTDPSAKIIAAIAQPHAAQGPFSVPDQAARAHLDPHVLRTEVRAAAPRSPAATRGGAAQDGEASGALSHDPAHGR